MTVQLAVDETWSCDLLVCSENLRHFNFNFALILVVEDNFSRWLWAEKLKTKSHSEVKIAFEKIIQENHGKCPTHIYADEVRKFFF